MQNLCHPSSSTVYCFCTRSVYSRVAIKRTKTLMVLGSEEFPIFKLTHLGHPRSRSLNLLHFDRCCARWRFSLVSAVLMAGFHNVCDNNVCFCLEKLWHRIPARASTRFETWRNPRRLTFLIFKLYGKKTRLLHGIGVMYS